MIKKTLAVLLALSVLFSFTGCSGSHDPDGSSDALSTSSKGSGGNINDSKTLSAPQMLSAMFMEFSPARQIYAVDITQVNDEKTAFLRSMQGLVAKTDDSAIYYISEDYDRFWLDYMRDELGVYYTEVTVEQLLTIYSDIIKTVVLYTPDTFEYELAWNEALRRDNAVCTTYSVARDYGLIETTEVIDPRGVYADKRSAYEYMLGVVDGDKKMPVITSCGESSTFRDYLFASDAFMLILDGADWENELLGDFLEKHSPDGAGVNFTDTDADKEALALYSRSGYGCLSTYGFANATVFSSIGIKINPDRAKSQKGSGKDGSVYLSLIIDITSAGDLMKYGYDVCLAKRSDYNIAIQMPTVMYKLAPAVMLWYNVHAKQSGDTVVPDGGWTDIDQSAMPLEYYENWHIINNYLLENSGMTTAADNGQLRDCSDKTYGQLTSADGLLLYGNTEDFSLSRDRDGMLSIAVKAIPDIKSLYAAFDEIPADADGTLFCAYSIPVTEYFTKVPIYDRGYGSYGRKADGYYSLTEVVAMLNSRMKESVDFVSPSKLFSLASNS